MITVEERIIAIARSVSGRKASLHCAVDQDLHIVGDAADDFVEQIAEDFGEWVRDWPWARFLCFDEAVWIMSPLATVWRFFRLPHRDSAIPMKPVLERLELRHIVAVVRHGVWIEP